MRNLSPRRVGVFLIAAVAMLSCRSATAAEVKQPLTVKANCIAEITLRTEKSCPDPSNSPTVDVLITAPDGRQFRVLAFWAGGNQWRFRYSSGSVGLHAYRTECSDATDPGLHGVQGNIEVIPYHDDNALYRHGPIRVAKDQRHFEHADGTPFFWLGDTWWKCLCRRMTWEGFQELTADRKAKGFSVVQIVCGPYPDEGLFEPRWENEGGKPYLTRDFSVVNPKYFEYADRRLKYLVDAGIVPAIVGGWGRGDCDGMKVGVVGLKRHWRNLIARYGAYPTIWIVGGESGGPQWTEVARYVQRTDPYHRPSTMHPFDSARKRVTDESVISFDMLQTGHGDWSAALGAIPKLKAAYARTPVMPAMMGEYCYEGHMQTAFADVQRYVFWASMLSGSAGLTYGAAGVWHASVEGDPGLARVYDWTTWREGMNSPGSTQLGRGKKLLEQYPWAQFEPHPEWAEADCFAAGIPDEVRFIYQPRRTIYNWQGTVVKKVETNVPYSAFYFDPATGRRFDQGKVKLISSDLGTFEGHTQPLLYADDFDRSAVGFTSKGDAAAWKDYGTATQRKDGFLTGGKGVLSIVKTVDAKNVMVSCASARSNAEAGLVLRFQDPDNYVVALYSPHFRSIFIHDRRDGKWGAMLGKVDAPEVGAEIRLSAAAVDEYAALLVSDGKQTWRTPPVKVTNTASGKTGLWFHQIGEQQAFGKFEVSHMAIDSGRAASTGEYLAPDLPSPQDWVLVLERVKL